jgi:hypothetical protein
MQAEWTYKNLIKYLRGRKCKIINKKNKKKTEKKVKTIKLCTLLVCNSYIHNQLINRFTNQTTKHEKNYKSTWISYYADAT